ncbi:MAG: DUF2917 domain-containing protein [Nitrospirae bacterium]|nr:DUF2917 domain-containing protein [Nitrospirota bacterium]
MVSKIPDGKFKGLFKLILDENSILRIDGDRRGTRISCIKGAVYITQQNDIKDHVLPADESFLINRQGRIIIWALSAAAIEIDFCDTGRYCLIERLRRFIAMGGL